MSCRLVCAQDVLGDNSIIKQAVAAAGGGGGGGGGPSGSRGSSGGSSSTKRRPSVGDQVSFTVRRVTAKGCPGPGYLQQDDAFERYTLGSQLCCRGVEIALETMREGETSSFYVRLRHLPPETAYPEEGAYTHPLFGSS